MWLRNGAIFRLWHQNWCHLEPPHLFPVGEAIYQGVFEKTSKNSVAAQESGYCPSLSPWLKAILCPLKKIPSPNPWLEVVLSTYPARISPTIPYSNFCGWKTTRFMKKFPTPLYRNFRSQKTKYFPNLFQKNVLTPLPHVFEPKTEALLQKTFSTIYHTFSGKKRTRFSKKVSYSYTACFFRRI